MRILLLAPMLLLAGCFTTGARTVATDVQALDKPIPVRCKVEWPKPPTPYVAQVQLAGDPMKDMVAIYRAMEAELEDRIAYEPKLEAALQGCVDGAPAK